MTRSAQDRDVDRELIGWAQGADARRAQWARDRLVARHAGLIATTVRRYYSPHMEWSDFYNEGVVGFLQGVARFDLGRDIAFSTYAILWVRCCVLKAVCPVKHSDAAVFWRTSRAGRDVPDEDLAAQLGVRVAKVRRVREASATPSSLDQPIAVMEEGHDMKLSDVLADPDAVDAEAALMAHEREVAVRRAMRSLKPRERAVLKMRFGFYTGDTSDGQTLEAVGTVMGFTRENARLIQNKAIKKLARALEQQGVTA